MTWREKLANRTDYRPANQLRPYRSNWLTRLLRGKVHSWETAAGQLWGVGRVSATGARRNTRHHAIRATLQPGCK
jgi:hypothetical protein